MKLVRFILLICAIVAVMRLSDDRGAAQPATTREALAAQQIRFEYVDVYLDPHGRAMAAYEFEFKSLRGNVKIVGIEGGDNKGFQDPPYYDDEGIKRQEHEARVLIGAYSLGDELPAGRVRVARIHVSIEGADRPDFAVRVVVAGAKDGTKIPADATFVEGAAR